MEELGRSYQSVYSLPFIHTGYDLQIFLETYDSHFTPGDSLFKPEFKIISTYYHESKEQVQKEEDEDKYLCCLLGLGGSNSTWSFRVYHSVTVWDVYGVET